MTKVSYTAGVTINPCKTYRSIWHTDISPRQTRSGRDRATTTIHSLTKRSMHRHTGSSSQAEWPRSKRKSRLIPRQTTRRSSLFGQLFPVGAHFRYRSEPEILKPPRFPVKSLYLQCVLSRYALFLFIGISGTTHASRSKANDSSRPKRLREEAGQLYKAP